MSNAKDLQKQLEAEVKALATYAAAQYRGFAPILRAVAAMGAIDGPVGGVEVMLASGGAVTQSAPEVWLASKDGRVYQALRAFVAQRLKSRCPDDGLACRLDFAWSFDEAMGQSLPCGEGCAFDAPAEKGALDSIGDALHGVWDGIKGMVGIQGGACCASCAKGGPCESGEQPQKASKTLGPSSDFQRISGEIPADNAARRESLLKQHEALRWKCTTLGIVDTVVAWGPVGFLAQAYEAISGQDLAQATVYCQQAAQIEAELRALGANPNDAAPQATQDPAGKPEGGGVMDDIKNALGGFAASIGLAGDGDKASVPWYERAIESFFSHVAWSMAITVIVVALAGALAVWAYSGVIQGGQTLAREALPLAPDLIRTFTPQGRALAMVGGV